MATWLAGTARAIGARAAAAKKHLLHLIDKKVRPPRLRTTGLLILFGLTLIAASALLGVAKLVHILPCTSAQPLSGIPPRQVGYLVAPNWALTSTIVWPAMFYALRSLLRAADSVFEEIDSSPMAWLATRRNQSSIRETWSRQKVNLRRAVALAGVIALVFSASEWWGASGSPLLQGTRPAEGETDWSSIRSGRPATDAARAAFTFAAFMYQGIAITLMASFAVAVILIARTMGLHGTGEAKPPLLADIESNDPFKRGGFERFVVIIDYMILFVFLSFVNFFLTRVQNAYLRDFDHDSILDFIQKDFVILDLNQIRRLFEVGSTDYSSLAVAIGSVLALFQCFFFFNATLRHAALQARSRADSVLLRSPLAQRAASTGLDADKIRERLREMNVWPLGYSDLMPTLSFLTICGATIIFYRIGLYLVFLWIAGWILARAAQGLVRRS